MIQSILIIFLFGCFGTVTNAELCTDCAKFILETEYKPKDWPVLEPRPKVVGGTRKNRNKIGQETNYGSGINGKRIRGRSRNNFDEMENEFQLPTSYDNQGDENNFLDFLRERMLVELENDIVTGREEENKNWRWDI